MARSIRRLVVAGAVAFGLGLTLTTSARAQIEPPPLPPLPQVPQLAPAGHITSPVCGDILVIAALGGVVLADLPVEVVPQLLNVACQAFPPPLEPVTCSVTDPIDPELESIPANVDAIGWIAGAIGAVLEPIGGDAVLEPLGCAPIAAPTAPGGFPEAPPPEATPPIEAAPIIDVPLGSLVGSDVGAFTGDGAAAATGSGQAASVAAPAGGSRPGVVQPGRVGSVLPASTTKPEEWTAGRYLGMLLVPGFIVGGFVASAWARRAPE